MAGALVNTYAIGDVNLDNMMTVLDDTRRGYHQLSLTEMTTTTVPKIAAGSQIEVGGALYQFANDETLGGSPSDGTVYIYIVPAGATCTAVMTNTAPTWSDAKQGWYGTGGAATYRYVHYIMTKATAAYTKYMLINGRSFSDYINTNGGALTAANGIIASTGNFIGNLAAFSGVSVLTGTLPSSAPASIAYPSGFTRDNSVILSVMLYDSVSSRYDTSGSTTLYYFAFLTASDIGISWGHSTFNSQNYRVILAKIA